jgi:hypothetical protein
MIKELSNARIKSISLNQMELENDHIINIQKLLEGKDLIEL